LAGLQDTRQLIVTLTGPSGVACDLTRTAQYTAAPSGLIAVTPQGYVQPIRPGEATITVESSGRLRSVHVVVRDSDRRRPWHFANDISPLLTRYGCNGGGCHGKASGQNGFKLSLFGYEPAFDYDAIVHEGHGRRVFPAAPERSLLLLKPTGQVPHGGGRLFELDSEAHETLRLWIAQGMPQGESN